MVYFLYFAPLLIATVFATVGLRALLGKPVKSHGKPVGPVEQGCFGVLFSIVGVSLSIAILFFSPTPWTRAHVVNTFLYTPPSQIPSIQLLPINDSPAPPGLTAPITITARQDIDRIIGALNAATS